LFFSFCFNPVPDRNSNLFCKSFMNPQKPAGTLRMENSSLFKVKHKHDCVCVHVWKYEFPAFESHFFTYISLPWTLNRIRLCWNSSAFQVDRGVSEGLSVELARDSTWWSKGKSIPQH
jgi:hypothetical protein